MDELFESLTLIQTGKIGTFPVVLFDSDYWEEMLDWVRGEMLADGLVSAGRPRASPPHGRAGRGRRVDRDDDRAARRRRGRPERARRRRRGRPRTGGRRARRSASCSGAGWARSPTRSRSAVEIPYEEIPGWPLSTAIGHAGVLVARSLRRGRGRGAQGSGAPLRGASGRSRRLRRARPGAARGAEPRPDERLRRDRPCRCRPGRLVAVSDHLNLQGTSPLVGPNDDALGPRFPDLTDAYDPDYRRLAHEAADAARARARRRGLRGLARPRLRDAGGDPHDAGARRRPRRHVDRARGARGTAHGHPLPRPLVRHERRGRRPARADRPRAGARGRASAPRAT